MSIDPRSLCDELIRADSEAEVIRILQAAGYWDDPRVWRFFGDQPENYPTVGNQQSRAERALIEKLMNSIDTKLIAAAKLARAFDNADVPQSLFEASQRFFGEAWKDPEALSKSITVAATGQMGRAGRPCFTIVDDGEGQTPLGMPNTILSLHKGNKSKIPFVQGKFNMGGSGVLEYCGVEHNVQLVLSRRHPHLRDGSDPEEDRWSFTIVRREDPAPGERSSRYTFLAPGTADLEGRRSLLTFAADTLDIFPEKNRAYARPAEWGTLFKLYEYGVTARTGMMFEDGLMSRVRVLLPEPGLPIRFHECRAYRGDPNRSFDTTMVGLLATLEEERRKAARRNVEFYDKFVQSVAGETFTVRVYAFRAREKDEAKNPADNYRKNEGVVFTYNGQTQGVLTKDFFRRARVRQDYLANSLLVIVDCTALTPRGNERFFMPNREQLREDSLVTSLITELEDRLRRHPELERLANERKKSEASLHAESSEGFEKFLEAMLKKHPELEKLLGPGFRISNPFKPRLVEAADAPWKGKRFPTYFHFKGRATDAELRREAFLNSQVRLSFETDAENDYFRRDEAPGSFEFYRIVDGTAVAAKSWHTPNLFEGVATVSLGLPENAAVGDVLEYEARITDSSRVEPFVCRAVLTVRAEKEMSPGGERPERRKQPDEKKGSATSGDSQLGMPKPIEVWEPDWSSYEPPFGKATALRIMQAGGDAPGGQFDYLLNMDNVHLNRMIKDKPARAGQLRDRYRFALIMLGLALVRHDKERSAVAKDGVEAFGAEKPAPDVRDIVADASSAIAPFILPLVDALAAIEARPESWSDAAGEAA